MAPSERSRRVVIFDHHEADLLGVGLALRPQFTADGARSAGGPGSISRQHADPLIACQIRCENRDDLVMFWSHVPRQPWQTERYYTEQRRHLRPSTYLRLHENRWAVAESAFITPELWHACVASEHAPLLPTTARKLFLGVDASTKHDSSAVVGVYVDDNRVVLALHRIWRPNPTEPLDLEATIEAYLRDLHRRYRVSAILCDPYQLHRSITTLRAAGLPIHEFPQTTANTTRMGQCLFDLLNGRNLRVYPAADLREHALNTVAVESPRGWRIAKEKASRKIDAIMALTMACVAALEARPSPLQIFGPGPAPVEMSREEQVLRRLDRFHWTPLNGW
jgi:hypothetical protein